MPLTATCDILAARIDAPMAKETGYLCVQLLIALIAAIPISIRHSTTPIQLQGGIELPLAQPRLVLCGDEAFVFVGKWLFAKHATNGRFDVGAAIGGGERKALEQLAGGLCLPRV